MVRRAACPEDAWIPISGRPPGWPRTVRARNPKTGRFVRLTLPAPAHWRWYLDRIPITRTPLPPGLERWAFRGPRITYHNRYANRFRIAGRYADRLQVQWVMMAQLAESLPPEITYVGPQWPDYEDQPDYPTTDAEGNDTDVSRKDLVAILQREGERSGWESGDDPDERLDLPFRIRLSDDPTATLVAIRDWEDRVVDTPLYAWIQAPVEGRPNPEALLISYWVVAERFVSQDEVFWGLVSETALTTFGTVAYERIREQVFEGKKRPALFEVDEFVVLAAAGCMLRMALFEPEEV